MFLTFKILWKNFKNNEIKVVKRIFAIDFHIKTFNL